MKEIKSQTAISTILALVSSIQENNKKLEEEIRENDIVIKDRTARNTELELLRTDNQSIIDHLSELLPR